MDDVAVELLAAADKYLLELLKQACGNNLLYLIHSPISRSGNENGKLEEGSQGKSRFGCFDHGNVVGKAYRHLAPKYQFNSLNLNLLF